MSLHRLAIPALLSLAVLSACAGKQAEVSSIGTAPPPRSTSASLVAVTKRSSGALARSRASTVSTPRSNRFDASLESLWRLDIRATTRGVKWAASRARSLVVSSTSVSSPPMVPASPMGPRSSVMRRSSPSSVRATWSRVSRVSPGAARRTTIGPRSFARSNACSGWPVSSMT